MKFISRAEWGAQYAQGSGAIPGPVYGVTLHWEGPHMGDFSHSICTRKVRTIERFHATVRGWSGIAYTAVVCPHGYVFEGRGIGVRSAANGTSAIGGNDHWYAVCYLGGEGDGFTGDGKHGFADAIGWLRSHGAGQKVNGHRDHHPTECPGDDIYRWLNRADFAHLAQEDDDMPYTDWPQKDREALAGDVVRELLDHKINKTQTFVQAIRDAGKADAALRALADLPNQIEASLPTTSTLTRNDVRSACAAAVRNVLGDLDEEK